MVRQVAYRLSINALKTVAIVFNQHSTNKISQMSLNNHNIPWFKNVKYLGVHLNDSLTFTTHIKETIKKATKIWCMLYPILNRRSPITIATKLSIFQMYVRSIISYATSAWSAFISRANWLKLEFPKHRPSYDIWRLLSTSLTERF